jgi:DNA repair protein RadA/Sms
MQWLGKCPTCNEWNTLEEEHLISQKSLRSISNITQKVKSLSELEDEVIIRDVTGINEFDRVMGGGISPGSVTLIGGQPGVGKSTLLLEVINKVAINKVNEKILYVSGEESLSQLGSRAKRLGIHNKNILMLNEGLIQSIFEVVKSIKPTLVIIDSIQTTYSSEVSAMPGSLSQIKEVTYEIIKEFKENNITSIIVGHITKEGGLAGPKLLEHMVDTVIYFEGDKTGQYRLLRTNKNRFGNTNEIGVFKMVKKGLVEVKNPVDCFINDVNEESTGRSITCITEGSRTLFIEIQALVVENKVGNGKRSSVGVDQGRVLMLVGVIEKYIGISLSFYDIYINVVGGLKTTSTTSDLSIIASILSSYISKPLKCDVVFIGEVGLCGEIRVAPFIENKIKEIVQMNYKTIYLSSRSSKLEKSKNIELNPVGLKSINDLNIELFNI